MFKLPKIELKSNVHDFVPDVINKINNSLIEIFKIQTPEYTKIGRTNIKILRIKGIIYEIFGGYGFEKILNDKQLKNIYDNEIGTSDIDIKILLIGNPVDERIYNDILESIKQKITKINGIGNLKQIRMGKLSHGFASKYVDVIVGNLKEYSVLKYFFSDNNIRDLRTNWIYEYSLYSAIHMFLLLYKILYVSKPDCIGDKKRIPKLKKIFGRICIFYNESIPTDIYTNREFHFHLLNIIKQNNTAYFNQISQYLESEFQNSKPMDPEEFMQPRSLFLPRIGKQNGGYDNDYETEESKSEIEESKSEIKKNEFCPILNYEQKREIFGKEEYEQKYEEIEDFISQNGNGVKSKENYPLYKSTIFILSGFVLLFSTLSTS
jgi:hypothetical protein